MKTCTKCGETKLKTEFSKRADNRDRLHSWCKACNTAASAACRAANPEKAKAARAAHYAANRERKKADQAAYYAANTDKAKAASAAYRAAYPEKVLASNAAWSAANPEKVRAAKAAWASANPEKVKATQAAYRANNPEAGRINTHNHNARKRENGGELSKGLAAKLFKLQRGKCACCGLPLGDNYHKDHIMPIALGGANIDSNIQLLRERCNKQKSAKHPTDFMRLRGFLI